MKKSTQLHRLVTVAVLAANLLLNAGCFLLVLGAVGGAVAGTMAYADGNLTATLGNNYDAVVKATNLALDQLPFAKPEERKDELSDTLTTHTAKGDSVKIVISNVNETLTKVEIRIGMFGDQQMSETILDKIKANLAMGS